VYSWFIKVVCEECVARSAAHSPAQQTQLKLADR
jgi:hypothetical protein